MPGYPCCCRGGVFDFFGDVYGFDGWYSSQLVMTPSRWPNGTNYEGPLSEIPAFTGVQLYTSADEGWSILVNPSQPVRDVAAWGMTLARGASVYGFRHNNLDHPDGGWDIAIGVMETAMTRWAKGDRAEFSGSALNPTNVLEGDPPEFAPTTQCRISESISGLVEGNPYQLVLQVKFVNWPYCYLFLTGVGAGSFSAQLNIFGLSSSNEDVELEYVPEDGSVLITVGFEAGVVSSPLVIFGIGGDGTTLLEAQDASVVVRRAYLRIPGGGGGRDIAMFDTGERDLDRIKYLRSVVNYAILDDLSELAWESTSIFDLTGTVMRTEADCAPVFTPSITWCPRPVYGYSYTWPGDNALHITRGNWGITSKAIASGSCGFLSVQSGAGKIEEDRSPPSSLAEWGPSESDAELGWGYTHAWNMIERRVYFVPPFDRRHGRWVHEVAEDIRESPDVPRISVLCPHNWPRACGVIQPKCARMTEFLGDENVAGSTVYGSTSISRPYTSSCAVVFGSAEIAEYDNIPYGLNFAEGAYYTYSVKIPRVSGSTFWSISKTQNRLGSRNRNELEIDSHCWEEWGPTGEIPIKDYSSGTDPYAWPIIVVSGGLLGDADVWVRVLWADSIGSLNAAIFVHGVADVTVRLGEPDEFGLRDGWETWEISTYLHVKIGGTEVLHRRVWNPHEAEAFEISNEESDQTWATGLKAFNGPGGSQRVAFFQKNWQEDEHGSPQVPDEGYEGVVDMCRPWTLKVYSGDSLLWTLDSGPARASVPEDKFYMWAPRVITASDRYIYVQNFPMCDDRIGSGWAWAWAISHDGEERFPVSYEGPGESGGVPFSLYHKSSVADGIVMDAIKSSGAVDVAMPLGYWPTAECEPPETPGACDAPAPAPVDPGEQFALFMQGAEWIEQGAYGMIHAIGA